MKLSNMRQIQTLVQVWHHKLASERRKKLPAIYFIVSNKRQPKHEKERQSQMHSAKLTIFPFIRTANSRKK